MAKVPEDRYATLRQMRSALFSIRVALSGAHETTERLSLNWTPIPAAVLRLVTHAPVKWRAAALTALMGTALVLFYVSRSPSPAAAPAGTRAPGSRPPAGGRPRGGPAARPPARPAAPRGQAGAGPCTAAGAAPPRAGAAAARS